MGGRRVHICGMGIISPLGRGVEATLIALRTNSRAISPLRLFPTPQRRPLPAGEIREEIGAGPLPRTHHLAAIAASEALAGSTAPPDAIILGQTTGGILTTEDLLRGQENNPVSYRHHGLLSVAGHIAGLCHCTGPALTVSTACSSGNVALKLALEMIRSGRADRVLAGGVDSLCRLTYFGFHSLQLVDPEGARPFAADRKGMSVAEGAAMLLLEADQPGRALAELLGAGLSCDAYHPAAPHPEGRGARQAMAAALADAGLVPADIDYISLHGTGTPDNDRAEARAVNDLFNGRPPCLSSIKGAMGHSLGAAGAIEAVLSALIVREGVRPANTGCRTPDPELALTPLAHPLMARPAGAVLSNAFGFGGNNASVVITQVDRFVPGPSLPQGSSKLTVISSACLTGAGATGPSLSRLAAGQPVFGLLPLEEISKGLPPRLVRRLKRLPRMALALALAVHEGEGRPEGPTSVFMGTGWGALSETHDFLTRLFETEEQFPSPSDFVGSVHNAPASQIAIRWQATGPNMTTSGGNYSFEQALLAASIAAPDQEGPFIVMAADEFHPRLSPLFDPFPPGCLPTDGGGALLLTRRGAGTGPTVSCPFYQGAHGNEQVISALVESLGGGDAVKRGYGLFLAGLPVACRPQALDQLNQFLALTGVTVPVIDYRQLIGEFASASAVAAVMAVHFLEQGQAFGSQTVAPPPGSAPRAALILGLGPWVTAVEVKPS